jgi:hypothetical protein
MLCILNYKKNVVAKLKLIPNVFGIPNPQNLNSDLCKSRGTGIRIAYLQKLLCTVLPFLALETTWRTACIALG